MAASSVTGTGAGDCNKATLNDLSIRANGPHVVASGMVTVDAVVPSSPPVSGADVLLPKALPEGGDFYVVILTTLNGGAAYVGEILENDDGQMTGFTVVVDDECDLMYIVATKGCLS